MLKKKDLMEKRSYNLSLAQAFHKVGEDKTAEDLEYCSKYSKIATCQKCGTKYYGGSYYCKSRFCAVCAKMRAMAWLSKLVPLLKEYREKGYLIFFLNLTIKDQSRLKDGINYIQSAWRYMTHDNKGSMEKFRALNDGGVRSVEIKIGENSGVWHPHIHSIVIIKSDRNVYQYEDYKKLWERAVAHVMRSSDKVGSVFIKGITNKDKDGNDGLFSAVIETFKYMTKLDKNLLTQSGEMLKELVTETHGRHFINSWGVLYKLNEQVEELLNRTTEEELKGLTCNVCGCTEFELDTVLTNTFDDSIKEFYTDKKSSAL